MTMCEHVRMAKYYLEPIISVFHCLRLDNWRTVVVAVNLSMFLGSLVYKEQYYIWFLAAFCGTYDKLLLWYSSTNKHICKLTCFQPAIIPCLPTTPIIVTGHILIIMIITP